MLNSLYYFALCFRSFLCSLFVLLLICSAAFAQQVTISVKEVPLPQVLNIIRQQTGKDIIGNLNVVTRPVTLKVKNGALKDVLQMLSEQQSLDITLQRETIVVKVPKSSKNIQSLAQKIEQPICLGGTIIDSLQKPLAGASISLDNTNIAVATNQKGEFSLGEIDKSATVTFSSLGYHPLTVEVTELEKIKFGTQKSFGTSKVLRINACYYKIILIVSTNQLDVVDINMGIFSRKQESFTGVTRTFSGDEIRNVNRVSLLEALGTLDPSFKIMRNNQLGSDPNQPAKIELRGTRSITPVEAGVGYNEQLRMQYEQDPNQPLFILDGFETSLQNIVNLDINRIGAITLLKDAASTALYGPRSANGVIVIETIKPIPGQLRISYSATGSLAVPDFTGYNLMDAQELLDFQVGMKDNGPFRQKDVRTSQKILGEAKRNFRQYQVLRGVNTDWLSVPVRNAFSMNHSLTINGGDQAFSYTAGVFKRDNKGVMLGSGNKSFGGNMTLSYRKNRFNFSNNFQVSSSKNTASPYGDFSKYSRLPPYYSKYDSNGNLRTDRYLEYTTTGAPILKDFAEFYYPNPLYDALLPSKNETRGLQLTNNLSFFYDLTPWLRVSVGGQYLKSTSSADFFRSPLRTEFVGADPLERGRYDAQTSEQESYSGNTMLTFNKLFAKKHIVNANLRGEIRSSNASSRSLSAVGFAESADPLLYLAGKYPPNSRPGGVETPARSLAFTASVNYSYDQRYNLDLSYNRSGSNSFGSDNPFRNFYSAGLGWNIGNEAFLKGSKVINMLRLSANVGVTGNQYAGGYGSQTTYLLNNAATMFGEALNINKVGNTQLAWTETYKASYSLNAAFFQSKLAVSMAGYYDVTDPLIIELPLAPSVGIKGYPTNIGRMKTNGLELIMNMKMLQTPNWTWNLGFNSPIFLRSTYSGLNDKLATMNDAARENDYLQRYSDGSGPYDLWALPSAGIDPATGQEVFLDQADKYTFLFDVRNERKVGTSRPLTEGSINTQLRYKRFSLSIYCRYLIGESKFNSVLYDKVENIRPGEVENNQDRRALYDRWQKPGDQAAYLDIASETKGMSDRFLLKENAVYFDAIALNYDFNELVKKLKLKRFGLSRLNFSLNLNDLFKFQLSNVRLERGLNYPFARNFSFSLQASF